MVKSDVLESKVDKLTNKNRGVLVQVSKGLYDFARTYPGVGGNNVGEIYGDLESFMRRCPNFSEVEYEESGLNVAEILAGLYETYLSGISSTDGPGMSFLPLSSGRVSCKFYLLFEKFEKAYKEKGLDKLPPPEKPAIAFLPTRGGAERKPEDYKSKTPIV